MLSAKKSRRAHRRLSEGLQSGTVRKRDQQRDQLCADSHDLFGCGRSRSDKRRAHIFVAEGRDCQTREEEERKAPKYFLGVGTGRFASAALVLLFFSTIIAALVAHVDLGEYS